MDHILAGNPHGATRRNFALDAFDGTDSLEITGMYGFTHICGPSLPALASASTNPYPVHGQHSLHIDSLIVAVDGACPGNGTSQATLSACGVFFYPESPDNLVFRVPNHPEHPHTNQRAELIAAIAAIDASQKFIYNGGQ